MYFDFHAFSHLVYLSLFQGKAAPTPLTFKRVLHLLCFLLFFPLIQLFNSICFLIDNLLFPGYRNLKLKHPVFIIGPPRSGTTLLHRLMAKDMDHFFCFKMWEIIFPAIIQKKIFSLMGRIDRFAGSVFSKIIRRFESMLLGDFLDKHPTGLFHFEEDEMLLIHIFCTVYLLFFFPFIHEVEPFIRFDLAVKPENRKIIMQFYVNCLKRQAYFKGNKKNLLSKNPAFSAKIDTLYTYFPDCKIIYMVRNPLNVVPSMISDVLATCIYSLNQTKATSHFHDHIYETAQFFYTYPLERLDYADESTFLIVNYENLIERPRETIQTIYDHFGFEVTADYSKILKEEEIKSRHYMSKHVYSLDQFNLSQEKIVKDFHSIFKQFGFDTREAAYPT